MHCTILALGTTFYKAKAGIVFPFIQENDSIMKTNVSQQTGRQTKKSPDTQHQSRPENKDNLDSRSGEEQDDKGKDQTTHNTREKHSSHKKQ